MKTGIRHELKNLRWRCEHKASAFVNCSLGRFKNIIWLIGDGRSGTTWVSSVINHHRRFREMFEPFHPNHVPGMDFLEYHQYIRPGSPHFLLEKASDRVFSGRLVNRRVDSENDHFFFDGLLVKDIFANLFSFWVHQRFPNIKIILLLRNPFAVALSKSKRKNWRWMTDPEELLRQKDLNADFLKEYEGYIVKVSREGDFIERQLVIWSVINSIPLRQFEPKDIYVLSYEKLISDPRAELKKIYQFLTLESIFDIVNHKEVLEKPSRVSGRESNVNSRLSDLHSWKREVSSRQIRVGCEALDLFGLSEYYKLDI